MKRPQGFDPGARQEKTPAAAKDAGSAPRVRGAGAGGAPRRRPTVPAASAPVSAPASSARPVTPFPGADARRNGDSADSGSTTAKGTGGGAKRAAARAEAEARRELRRASRERKRFERDEVKRFTRRTRRRKAGWITAAVVVAVMGGLLAIAVYSPLLALRNIQVVGASRIPPETLVQELDDQLGTPLPLLDLGEVKRKLGAFPLIQSYSTESRPPDTLVVRVVERAPIASVRASGGGFDLVDPAGVVVERADARPGGFPVIDVGAPGTSNARFEAAAQVLVALPAEFLAQVDVVNATTKDDVSLVLTDGKRVVWGSADQSDVKAARLPALVKATADRDVAVYDVSSPDNLVVR
jgi:cell division protein FtsQ